MGFISFVSFISFVYVAAAFTAVMLLVFHIANAVRLSPGAVLGRFVPDGMCYLPELSSAFFSFMSFIAVSVILASLFISMPHLSKHAVMTLNITSIASALMLLMYHFLLIHFDHLRIGRPAAMARA